MSFPDRYKLPARAGAFVMPMLLSVLMTCVVSAISTARIVGPGWGFVHAWPANWAMSWLIAFPTLLAILPLVRRITGAVVRPAS